MKIWTTIAPLALLVLLPAGGMGQTVSFSPAALSRVPKGATASNPYWQHLVITLAKNPSAGNSIAINLPSGIFVADVNGNGSFADEISIDNEPGTDTGYRTATGTTAKQINLQSPTGSQTPGRVHVQFPITTPSKPASSAAPYGQISFSKPGEVNIPAAAVSLTLVGGDSLSLATHTRAFVDVADTTSNLQGDAYPNPAAPVFASPLPDLVSDRLGSKTNTAFTTAGVLFADGIDTNDVVYSFWFSTRDSLALVDTTTALRAIDSATGLKAKVNEGNAATFSFDLSALSDTTYYLYTTSNLTGRFPLSRSRGVTVRHQPVVISVGTFQNNNADYLDSGLLLNVDTGVADLSSNARDNVDLPFTVADFDDSASVRLFYATADTLDTTFVQTSGTSPSRKLSGLTNATDIDSTAGLVEGKDSQQNWRIVTNDTTFVPAGNYYIYAVTTDGKNLGIGRTTQTYNVRHSPFIALDARRDTVLNTGGPTPQRYYTITWNGDRGARGDIALTDSATIDLYYSASDTFSVPGGVAALQAAAADSTRDTHLIAGNLQEQPDARADNQHVWDLWTFRNSDGGGVPIAQKAYSLYGVIKTDSTSRLTRWNDAAGQARSITFRHDPHLKILSPRGPVAMDGRRSLQVSWTAADVDENANLWVLLTTKTAGQALGSTTTYGSLTADAQSDWVANSTDGSLASGQALREDVASGFAVRPARLQLALGGGANPVNDGDYYTYVVIDPTAASTPPAASLAIRAPGLVTIEGLGPAGAAGLDAPTIELLPGTRVVEANGDTTTLSVRPNTRGTTVDLVSVFLSLDTLFFNLVDQNTTLSGVQPFALSPGATGLTLTDTLKAGADSTTAGKWLMDLVYFEQAGTAALNGDSTLATVQVISKDTVGTTEIGIDNLGARKTAFYREGEAVTLVPPKVGSTYQLKRRGSISGQVQLQGRTDHGGTATFLLRDRNSFVAIEDSIFRVANDADTTAAGIQDSTDRHGMFMLTNVPTGSYHLAVHVDGYLDGQFPALNVNPGDQLTGIDATILSDAVTDPGFLLGGDVTGYVDTSGASIPDNEVDQLDVDFVVSFFGQTVNSSHPGRLADLDADSLVWVSDLNIVAANFNREGVDPVFKAVQRTNDELGSFKITRREERDRFFVEVGAQDLQAVRAFGFDLQYDPLAWRVASVQPGDLHISRPMALAFGNLPGRVAVGGALLGSQPGIRGDATVLRLELAPLQSAPSSAAPIILGNAELVDETMRSFRPSAPSVLPSSFRLEANYPNPFNPETQIGIAVPFDGHITLEVYDAVGQVIAVLANERLPAGIYRYVWDGSDRTGKQAASGVYIARLASGTFVVTNKMLLLR